MNRVHRMVTAMIVSLTTTALAAEKADPMAAYEVRTHKAADGTSLPYRLLKPAGYDAKQKYPVLLFLHGAGERGDNNAAQLHHGGAQMAKDLQAAGPCFVIAPQCPNGKQWVNTNWSKGSYSTEKVEISGPLGAALEALAAARKEFSIDPNRVYIMGLSMGGYGTWDAVARNPTLFAAAVPICGAGDPEKAPALKGTAVWAFHGGNDTVVPTQGSRDMAAALEKAGVNSKYTEYPGVGHNSWSKAWAEPELWKWLLAQKRADAKDEK